MIPEEGGEGGVAPALAVAASESTDPEERQIWNRLRSIAQAGLPEQLATTWTELASLRSLYLRAQVEVWAAASADHGGHDTWGSGSYESWAQGERYRTSAKVPPGLNLVQFTDIAFDGDRLAVYLAQDGILSVRRGTMRGWPVAFRDPVALSVFFLNPFDEANCGRCELRLSDLRSTLPTALPRRGVAGNPLMLEVPPARFGAQTPSSYRLSELAEIDDRGGHPQVIEHLTKGGTVLERVELRNWNPVAGQPALKFPWMLTYEIFDDSGRGPLIRTTYKIEQIQANRQIAPEVFSLSMPGARIWDEDLRSFVP